MIRHFLAAALLVGLAVLSACGRGQDETKPATSALTPAPLADLQTAEVTRSGAGGTIAVPGVVQARRRATLAARLPGAVIELPYRIGDSVPKGAVVARLDDVALRAGLAAAEAAAANARADLARIETLVARHAATPRELDDIKARAAAADAQVTAARDHASYATLLAPFAGRVATRHVEYGDIVTPGQPLVELEGDGALEVRATIDAATAATLARGTVLRAQVDGLDVPVEATVSALSASGDPQTHRFEVKADLPAHPGLRAGLFARLFVTGTTAPRVLVPAAAVFERGGLVGAFTVVDGRVRLRWIAVGARESELVEVRAGLVPGERVVLDPPAALSDGATLAAGVGATP